jgi:hypothetical protein
MFREHLLSSERNYGDHAMNLDDFHADALITHADQLERAGKVLVEAAKKMREAATLIGPHATASSSPKKAKKPAKTGRYTRRHAGKTRLEQVAELLRKNGPMTRGDVRQRADLPTGTVSSILNTKNFERSEDGKWSLKAKDK